MSFLFSFYVLARFNRKDPVAQGWVFKKYYAYVYSVVRRTTGGSSDSADLTADVFEKLLKSSERFESLSKIKFFLYTSAKNRCIDYLRRQKIIQAKADDIRRHTSPDEEDELEKAESKAAMLERIHSAIEELPRQCRYIFLLYYAQGLTNSEIAKKLHLSEKTVSNQKTIAIRLIKIKISKINGASMTLLMCIHHYAFHLHHMLRVIKSVLG